MKHPCHENQVNQHKRVAGLLVVCGLLWGQAFPSLAGTPDEAAIQMLISTTYDTPEHKVRTEPIAVVGGYALADWTQGPRGGRALLKLAEDRWQIVSCGGDGFKNTATLVQMSIPDTTAKALIAHLAVAERSVDPARVRLFGLFGMPDDSGHGHDNARHANLPAIKPIEENRK